MYIILHNLLISQIIQFDAQIITSYVWFQCITGNCFSTDTHISRRFKYSNSTQTLSSTCSISALALGLNVAATMLTSLWFCVSESRGERAKRLFRHYTVGSYDSFDAPRQELLYFIAGQHRCEANGSSFTPKTSSRPNAFSKQRA